MILSKQQLIGGVATIAVTIVVIAGLFVAGSPSAERDRRSDEQRVSDLQNISFAIQSYYADTGSLPSSLEAAARQPNAYVPRVTDPETNTPYRYEPGTGGTYRLCATFIGSTPAITDGASVPAELSFWNHGAGESCFDLEARLPVGTSFKPIPME